MGGIHEVHRRRVGTWSGRLAAASTMCALGACAAPAPRAPTHVGTYALESVDGRPVPADVDSGRMVSAHLTLGADGNWTLSARSVAQRASRGGDTTVFRNHGKYTVEGQVLTLSGQTSADTYSGVGTLAGATITSREGGHVLVFRRLSTGP